MGKLHRRCEDRPEGEAQSADREERGRRERGPGGLGAFVDLEQRPRDGEPARRGVGRGN